MCVCVCFFNVGAASKRFGIDGDREAVPLMLEVVYNKVGCCLILFIINICIVQLHFPRVTFITARFNQQ